MDDTLKHAVVQLTEARVRIAYRQKGISLDGIELKVDLTFSEEVPEKYPAVLARGEVTWPYSAVGTTVVPILVEWYALGAFAIVAESLDQVQYAYEVEQLDVIIYIYRERGILR